MMSNPWLVLVNIQLNQSMSIYVIIEYNIYIRIYTYIYIYMIIYYHIFKYTSVVRSSHSAACLPSCSPVFFRKIVLRVGRAAKVSRRPLVPGDEVLMAYVTWILEINTLKSLEKSWGFSIGHPSNFP